MERRIKDVVIHVVEHGAGLPLVALHGAGVDHRDVEAALEPVVPPVGYRRMYVDLPGMGRSTSDGLSCNDDVVTMLGDLLADLGVGPVALVGHSYGAYLARGVAAKRPELLLGLALLCPVADQSHNVPGAVVVRQDDDAYDELNAALGPGFDDYFVVRTAATARRYRDHVAPGNALADEDALGRIFAGWPIDLGGGNFDGPTLIVAGRRDSVVGCTDAIGLLERYPHATLAVLEDAGHALMHEQPEVLAALMANWLERVRLSASAAALDVDPRNDNYHEV